jgi:phospholipase/carboxylesterase
MALETIDIVTGESPELAVLWLHGLGADGHDFVPIVAELRLPFGVSFVFPHAPVRPVTINAGARMRAWYDIFGFGATVAEDEAGIRASATAVGELVDRAIERGFATEQIVLAGFSQGGAIALHWGLRDPRPLAGILALSTYVPLAATLAAEAAATVPPIFMAHGTADPVIPLGLAEAGKRLLVGRGYAVDWRSYPMAHAVCAQEIRDIGVWLTARSGR